MVGERAILTSVRLGIVCAAIALLLGSPLAWFVSRMITAKRSVWLSLLNVAANFGGIGLAFAYMAALGTFGMVTLALARHRHSVDRRRKLVPSRAS